MSSSTGNTQSFSEDSGDNSNPSSPLGSEDYESPPEDLISKAVIYEAVNPQDPDLSMPPISSTRTSLKEIMSGNIVIGEGHEGSYGKRIIDLLVGDGHHKYFFMEQVSKDYTGDIDNLLKTGTFSDRLSALLTAHDSGHDTLDNGFLKMFSSFASKYKDGIRVIPIDRMGFRYRGGETGVSRVVGLNRDCAKMIETAFVNKDKALIDAIRNGRCAFLVGNSHAMRHQMDGGDDFTEPGIASRVNSVLTAKGHKGAYFSNLIVKDCGKGIEKASLAVTGLVSCDVTKRNEVSDMQDFAAENVLVCNEEVISQITKGDMSSVPALSFSEFQNLHSRNKIILNEPFLPKSTRVVGHASPTSFSKASPVSLQGGGAKGTVNFGEGSGGLASPQGGGAKGTVNFEGSGGSVSTRSSDSTGGPREIPSSSDDDNPTSSKKKHSVKRLRMVTGITKKAGRVLSAAAASQAGLPPSGTDIIGPEATKADQEEALAIFNGILQSGSKR